jgi:hypothetical protein
MLLAPEELAVDKEAGNAKDAGRLGRLPDGVVLFPPRSGEVVSKTDDVGAGLAQHALDNRYVLNVQLAPPEALERPVGVAA